MLAPVPPLSGKECRGDGLAGRVSGDLVARQLLQEFGVFVVGAGLAGGHSRVGLDHRVVDAAVAVGAFRAEAGQVGVDDVRVDGRHVGVGDVESLGYSGSEVLD